jgi:alanine dehydrogenase
VIVGVPREIKIDENRVALVPAGAEVMVDHGHRVLLENNAGSGSGFADRDYTSVGAEVVSGPADVFAQADLILKVKEPLPEEYPLIRQGQIIFTYLHLASSRDLTEALMASGCIAIGYETIETDDGELPLLTPMSEVAGRMAVQQGAKYLEREHGGRGVLLGGVPGVEPATVLILGGGTAGSNAARVAAGVGAKVYVLDVNLGRLRHLSEVMPPNVITLMSNSQNIRKLLREADVVISTVLIHGAKAPKLITRKMLGLMKPGAVVVDVAIDQGGSLMTSHATTHADPIFEVDGILHYCVANMPGAMPMTSTIALTNATFPYALEIVDLGFARAVETNPTIARGVNVQEGKIVYPGVADAFAREG